MTLIEIKHPLFQASILEQGAQIIHFQPAGAQPFLWSADLSTYCDGKPFRGGIPVCWPWFGKVQVPAHGFARIIPWELIDRDDNVDGVVLHWKLCDNQQTRAIWDYSFELNLQMRLGLTCELSLQITAPVETTGALHTYLYTDDVANAVISGLGNCYLDALDAHKLVQNNTNKLEINQTVDRIYLDSKVQNNLVDGWRNLCITHHSYSDVVVWNPWDAGAVTIPDMLDEDYRKMICIETARISKPFEIQDTLGLTIEEMKHNKGVL